MSITHFFGAAPAIALSGREDWKAILQPSLVVKDSLCIFICWVFDNISSTYNGLRVVCDV
jgi:hypothetical protein